MKKFTLLFCIACFLFVGLQPVSSVEATQVATQQVPSYAKWGQLAMKRTKETYPKAEIVDYSHLGRQEGPILTTEKFRLWLEEGEKEFGVNVTISFYKETESVKEVKLEEIKRKGKRKKRR
ncbi:DUF3889 domain-containing protein [Sutcliffiella horikoshii]|uniref:DUF3889 domain-containing protein n=1 Tax=Sutcliffiella horikoshii TaxID=79883 RepID=A0A5D4T4D9_9BACI|nr:DUF3889 domain-containing protein [Sutcliffiella horikoshii]TYS69771.1 DUF3889 domain-containing protein [Sutcliffiella horikoshii]